MRHYYYGRFSCGFHAKDGLFNSIRAFLSRLAVGASRQKTSGSMTSAGAMANTKRTIQRASCRIHLRLVAQASQPVQMHVEGRCSINDPHFFKILFIKNIKMISLNLILYQHRLESLCHQISWDRLMEYRWKDTFAGGSKDYFLSF